MLPQDNLWSTVYLLSSLLSFFWDYKFKCTLAVNSVQLLAYSLRVNVLISVSNWRSPEQGEEDSASWPQICICQANLSWSTHAHTHTHATPGTSNRTPDTRTRTQYTHTRIAHTPRTAHYTHAHTTLANRCTHQTRHISTHHTHAQAVKSIFIPVKTLVCCQHAVNTFSVLFFCKEKYTEL